jgi:hypothetical protein
MKRVYVILAFHAHEPLWDFPGQLQSLADREEIRSGTVAENYIKKRRESGRDIYLDMLEMGKRMDIPLCLETSNELLFQIEQFIPETFNKLAAAFQDGRLHPLLGHAHHTHNALLSETEIEDELRLNAEYLFGRMHSKKPEALGAFPTEDSIDSHKLKAYHRFGITYLVFPHITPEKCSFRAYDTSDQSDITYRPFQIAPGLLGLPRNFPISQYIWKPITQMKPEPLRSQGYLLGDYPVFTEEYNGKEKVSFPISFTEAVREYTEVLRSELEKAPENGALLYIQDLELMDFGDTALELMETAWSSIRNKNHWDLVFTTPEQYLNEQGYLTGINTLGRLEFDQISWAPEIRPVLRVDGHYPPLGVNEVKGVNVIQDYLRQWPFAFWEPGRYFTLLTNYLLDQAGFDLKLPASAEELLNLEYNPARINPELRIRLLGRLMKRACNWGWRPDEARQKRPLAALYLICQQLEDKDFQPLDRIEFTREDWEDILNGLKEIGKMFLSYRREYLLKGLENLDWLNEKQRERLDHVEHHRKNADLPLAILFDEVRKNGNIPTQKLIAQLKDYCRELFLGTELIQEVWGEAPEAAKLVTQMYRHLYELVPPGFLQYLRDRYGENRPEERVGIKEYIAEKAFAPV